MFNIYSKSSNGHRGSYIETFVSEFQCRSKNIVSSLFSNKPLVFLMVDDNLFLYTVCSIARNLLGFKTVGLVFRLKAYVDYLNYRDYLKFQILSYINKLSKITNVSILPFYVDDRFKIICSEWIYDPQLWDLLLPFELGKEFDKDILDLEKKTDNFKVVITSIGRQDASKGVVEFIKLSGKELESKEDIRFIFAGKMDTFCKNYFENHKNNVLGIDRFISDKEVYFMYNISTHIWCSYHKSYDQASGIFGRAVQLGKIPIIRKDSCIHKICDMESIPYILSDNIKSYSFMDVSVDQEKTIEQNSERKKFSINTIYRIISG